MKTKLTLEYDTEDTYEKDKVLRMLHADEAWYALSTIAGEIRAYRKYLSGTPEEMESLLTRLNEEIYSTQLDNIWR